jgi:hypothetical protein
VLQGSSLHAEFAFANVRLVTAQFRLGDLQLTGTELLETGRTVPITSGAGQYSLSLSSRNAVHHRCGAHPLGPQDRTAIHLPAAARRGGPLSSDALTAAHRNSDRPTELRAPRLK